MKELLAKNLIALFFLVPAAENAKSNSDRTEPQRLRVERTEQVHEMENALADISENIGPLKTIFRKLDNDEKGHWYMRTADKLTSQPEAVIRLMAAADIDPDCMCPRQFSEGEQPPAIDAWMDRAIAALRSFSMNDPFMENVRARCLGNIVKVRHGRAGAARVGEHEATPFGGGVSHAAAKGLGMALPATGPQANDASTDSLARENEMNLQWKTPVTVSRHRPPDAPGGFSPRPLELLGL